MLEKYPYSLRQDSSNMIRPEELESIESTLYAPLEDELMTRMVMPLKRNDPAAAQTVTYKTWSRKGSAKIFAFGMADDLPFVDTDINLLSQKVHIIATSIPIYEHEREAAAFLGVPLDSMNADNARRFVAEQEQEVWLNGSTVHDIKGIRTATGIQTYDPPADGTGSSKKWKDKDGRKIIRDIREARGTMHAAARGVRARSLVLHVEQFERLFNFTSDTNASDRMIIEFLELSSFFPGGIYSSISVPKSEAIILDNTPGRMQFSLTKDLDMRPPFQESAFQWMIAVEQRTAASVLYYPSAVMIIQNID